MNALAELLDSFRVNLRTLAQVRGDKGLRKKIDTSDIIQELNMQVFGDFHSFRGRTIAEFVKWIFEILKTKRAKAKRHFEAEKRNIQREQQLNGETEHSGEMEFADSPTEEHQPIDNMLQLEAAFELFDALNRLPGKQREVVILHFFEGLTLVEVGVHLEKSSNAIQKLWARALANLGKQLKENDTGDSL